MRKQNADRSRASGLAFTVVFLFVLSVSLFKVFPEENSTSRTAVKSVELARRANRWTKRKFPRVRKVMRAALSEVKQSVWGGQ